MQQRLNILVVDDWLDSAESLADLVRYWEHDAKTALDGPAALKLARESPPDVVILDISMPGMNGLEVGRSLREEHQGRPIHLIAVTGHGVESAWNDQIDAEFDTHLVKPANLVRILQILSHLAQKDFTRRADGRA